MIEMFEYDFMLRAFAAGLIIALNSWAIKKPHQVRNPK